MNIESLTDDEDFVETVYLVRNVRRRPQKHRERPNQFEIWNNKEFLKRYRSSKEGVRYVIDKISKLKQLFQDRAVCSYLNVGFICIAVLHFY